MKGQTFKTMCLVHGGKDFYICNTCWEAGGKRLLEKTIEELKTTNLPTLFEVVKGSITYCNVCKRNEKDIN